MALYSSNNQNLAQGDAISFQNTIIAGRCPVAKLSSTSFRLAGSHRCCNPAQYSIRFRGNVSGATGSIQLALVVNGEVVPESLMSVAPTALNTVLSVDSFYTVKAVDSSSVSVRVLSEGGAIINTGLLEINRIA